jgi:predicted nucleic acid-binding protein
MILTDTNVFSALMRLGKEPKVRHWLDHIDAGQLRVSAITLFETQYGIARLPAGGRREEINTSFFGILTDVFGGYVVPFDEGAAIAAGHVYALLRTYGRNVDVADCQIAGTAIARDAAVATRNTRDFTGLGLALINPWDE